MDGGAPPKERYSCSNCYIAWSIQSALQAVKLYSSMRDNLTIKPQLQKLGLSDNEASIFMTLLDKPKNPIEVSRLTGIARSNVYRIADAMRERGLIHEQTTSDGRVLAAAEPAALELLVIEHEHAAARQRSQFEQILPILTEMTNQKTDFSIQTYRGIGGLKQMLWNELKYKEILIFSAGSLNGGTGKQWAEKYRTEIIQRGIIQRSIENTHNPQPTVTDQLEYDRYYIVRYLPHEILNIQPEISIHGDSISIYNSWTHQLQLGAEIHNPFLAELMRQMFEHYWQLAEEKN